MTATYFNTKTKESYTLTNVDGLTHAWQLGVSVIRDMNWSVKDFHYNVQIALKFV